MVNRGSTKSQCATITVCAHPTVKERETIPSSKNKMQNNVLFKATKNKIYANLVNLVTFKSEGLGL